MIKTFRLPVTEGAYISVVYQKPDDDTLPARPVKADPKKPRKKGDKDAASAPLRKPLIIMMHDFPGGHKSGCDDLFGELEYRFEGLGFPSVRFDFRSCGESDGVVVDFSIDTALEDLNAVIQWAQHDAGHRSFILLGEGFGGAMAVLGYRPKTIHGVMLLWPVLKPTEAPFAELFTREFRLESIKKDAPFVTYRGFRLGSHFLNDLYQMNLKSMLEKITVPTLLQYGSDDAEIPLKHIHFARDNLKGFVDLAIFEGGGHGLKAANMRQALFVNIKLFLDRVIKRMDTATKA